MWFRRKENPLINAMSTVISYIINLPEQYTKQKAEAEEKGLIKLTVGKYECKIEYEKQGEKWRLTVKEIGKHDINGKYGLVEDMKIEPFSYENKEQGISKIEQMILHWKKE